jgi:hypothetical protein
MPVLTPHPLPSQGQALRHGSGEPLMRGEGPYYQVTFRGGGPRADSNIHHQETVQASSPHVAAARVMRNPVLDTGAATAPCVCRWKPCTSSGSIENLDRR